MSAVAQPWLISKFFDPIFAACMGFSAAAIRIRRENKEKFPNQDSSYGALWQKGVMMSRIYFGHNPTSLQELRRNTPDLR